MRNIIISAGHGGKDPGAVNGPYIERDLAIDLRLDIATELFTKYGIKVISDPDVYILAQTLAWIRGKFGSKDILLDLHWNAGGGTGVEVIIPDVSSPFERSLAQALADVISSVTGLKKRSGGVKPESATPRKKLGWMRPSAENILIEVCFIDNKADMGTYLANKQTLVRSIAKVLADFSKL
jgi:N-acetylmuramoyl-L-alanine amidase